jgi:ribokinase
MDLMVKMARIPAKGETVIGGSFQVSPGGKGANQAVAASRLGGAVTMIGRVGYDFFGDMLVERLKAEKVDIRYVFRGEKDKTGVALIMVDRRGNNVIAVASGADESCSKYDVEAAREAISSAKVFLTQLEIPMATVEHATSIAYEGVPLIVLNPAPARQLPQQLLRKVDVIVPNALETYHLTGVRVHDVQTAIHAGKRLLRRGVENVLVTLGRRGVVVVNEKETAHLKGVRVRSVDATGAGDTFCGALAFGLARKMKIHEAAELANNAAALATTKLGAQEAMPTLLELHKFMISNGRARKLGRTLIQA